MPMCRYTTWRLCEFRSRDETSFTPKLFRNNNGIFARNAMSTRLSLLTFVQSYTTFAGKSENVFSLENRTRRFLALSIFLRKKHLRVLHAIFSETVWCGSNGDRQISVRRCLGPDPVLEQYVQVQPCLLYSPSFVGEFFRVFADINVIRIQTCSSVCGKSARYSNQSGSSAYTAVVWLGVNFWRGNYFYF